MAKLPTLLAVADAAPREPCGLPLRDACVDAVVTSPPYWLQRTFGVPSEIGLETSAEAYARRVADALLEVKRILKPLGTAWIIVGSKRVTSHRPGSMSRSTGYARPGQQTSRRAGGGDWRDGEFVPLPQMVADAMRADGWLVRDAIVWSKPSPRPETVLGWYWVEDRLRTGSWRPTNSHETVLIASHSMSYFVDQVACDELRSDGLRNLRSVWSIAHQSRGVEHPAPTCRALAERCIALGTSGGGVCAACGTPWAPEIHYFWAGHRRGEGRRREWLGYRPCCSCGAAPVPALVFDPFAGVGTVGLAAQKLGRRYAGTDRSLKYTLSARKSLSWSSPELHPLPPPTQPTVAALFVARGGVYCGSPSVEPWDADADARRYNGPWQVVAHPPCERYGRYWSGGPTAKIRRRLADDGGCFDAALAAVRRWGGVLEHPEATRAWPLFGLAVPPRHGGWVRADTSGGWTCCVEQGHFGHRARKATWLYVCGYEGLLPELPWGPSPPAAAGRLDVDGFNSKAERKRAMAARARGEFSGHVYPVWMRLSRREKLGTPVAFRDLLLSIARRCRASSDATAARPSGPCQLPLVDISLSSVGAEGRG